VGPMLLDAYLSRVARFPKCFQVFLVYFCSFRTLFGSYSTFEYSNDQNLSLWNVLHQNENVCFNTRT
jgi:hypothetical protein